MQDVIAKLMSKTVVEDDCWIYTGQPNAERPSVRHDGRTRFVYQWSFLAEHGYVPTRTYDGSPSQINHTCDRERCWNPAHLYAGTKRQNVRDMFERGLGENRRGSGHWKTKLTEDDVRTIRAEYAAGRATQAQLAKRYGVKGVGPIIRRETWAHVS